MSDETTKNIDNKQTRNEFLSKQHEMLAEDVWEIAGECGVDSGTIIIGDPCYYMDGGLKKQEVYNDTREDIKELPFSGGGHVGKGVVVGGFGGDGCYPVYVKKSKSGLIKEAMIKFYWGGE